MLDEFEIPNYTAIVSPATPSRKGGRPIGGLGVFISTALNVTIEKIHLISNMAVAALLQFADYSVICLNFYLPPKQSQAQTREIWKGVETCVVFCQEKYPLAMLLIGGDLNARMGTNDELLLNKYGISTLTDRETQTPENRWFLDPVANFAGLCLAQLVYKLNLAILNGVA